MNIIKEIYWERTNLILKFDELKQEEKFFLKCNKKNIELFPKNNQIKILLINTPEGSILPEGEWKIDCESQNITIDEELIPKLDDLSRVFKYKKDNYAYIVTFSINKNKTMYIQTSFMMKNKNPQKIYQYCECEKIGDKFKLLIKIAMIRIINIMYHIAHFLCFNKKNTVIFLNENDTELKDNGLAFYNYLKDKNKYKIKVYCYDNFKGKFDFVSKIKEIFLIASSNYIILDNYAPILTYLEVAKDVKIVQLWHAGKGFKPIGYARFGLKGSPHPYVSCHRKYDYVVVDEESLIEVFQELFGVSKSKFIVTGMPRLENYLDKNKIEKTINEIYKNNQFLNNKKIILFAPTFRGSGHEDAYYDMEFINQDKLATFCKENGFVVIFKFHPFTKNKIEIKEEYKDILYDYTFEYDINDLMYITDVLITDYSSCVHEYLFFDRPIIFYRHDKILYEYERKTLTEKFFTEQAYEAVTFEELIKNLEKVSSKPKFDIKKCEINNRPSACSRIEKEVFGGE